MAKKQKLHDYLICYEIDKSKYNKIIHDVPTKRDAFDEFKSRMPMYNRYNAVIINIIELL